MDKFFYFAYGSNMLEQRIHIKNPSAVNVGIGKLNVSNSKSTLTYKKLLNIFKTVMVLTIIKNGFSSIYIYESFSVPE